MTSTEPPYIILFDGVCNLCCASVQFVLKRDSKKIFRFGSLQSIAGQQLLEQYGLQSYGLHDPVLKDHDLQSHGWQNSWQNGLPNNGSSSMILLERQKVFTKSSAALTIAKYLDWPWPLLYGFIVVPRFLRDAVYDFIGKRRYQWFGKRHTCWIAPDSHKNRFLDDDNIEVDHE
jgi:predicted DCC family thiol-disulfide oxidoreductase YuxK